MLLADNNGDVVWNNMAAIILASATLLTVILNWLTNMFTAWLSHRNQLEMKQDLRANTRLCETIVPKVEDKTESALKAAEDAKRQAEKITETAAAKVGVLIGKALSDKATATADRVATVAAQNSAAIAEKIEKVALAVKGDDGTCITSKVAEHADKLNSLDHRMEAVEGKVSLIEGDTKQILSLLRR